MLRIFFRSRAAILTVSAAFFVFLYAVAVFFFHFSSPLEKIISSILLVTFYLGFVVLAFALSRDPRLGHEAHQGWFLLGCSSVCTAIAEGIWFYRDSILKVDPFVSAADIFFLCYYPLTLAGVLRFPYTSRTPKERTTLYLDLAIVMTASSMALSYFILSPEYFSRAEALESIVALAYPVGGMLLLTAVVGLLQSSAKKTTWWVLFLLGSGMFCNAIADAAMAYFEIREIPYRMQYLNILWMLAAVCLLSAAALQKVIGEPLPAIFPEKPSSRRLLFRRALPYLATFVGILVLFLAFRKGYAEHPQTILFETIILIVLVLMRQHLVIRENESLYKEMSRLAITDALTGLYNRHFADETLRLEFQRAKRYGLPLSILMIDLDGFKELNDRFGHLRGDEVLKEIARLLAEQLRSSDLLARFGGDEFIAILPQTEEEGARVVMDKIEQAVNGKTFQGSKLSVSIGMSRIRPELKLEEMLEESDRNLYIQKQQKHAVRSV